MLLWESSRSLTGTQAIHIHSSIWKFPRPAQPHKHNLKPHKIKRERHWHWSNERQSQTREGEKNEIHLELVTPETHLKRCSPLFESGQPQHRRSHDTEQRWIRQLFKNKLPYKPRRTLSGKKVKSAHRELARPTVAQNQQKKPDGSKNVFRNHQHWSFTGDLTIETHAGQEWGKSHSHCGCSSLIWILFHE